MKFSLLNIVNFALFVLVGGYLTAKLTFGSKGILEYYSLEYKYNENQNIVEFLKKENKKLKIKIDLLNEKVVNLMYLEELARTKLHFGREDEKLIILE